MMRDERTTIVLEVNEIARTMRRELQFYREDTTMLFDLLREVDPFNDPLIFNMPCWFDSDEQIMHIARAIGANRC